MQGHKIRLLAGSLLMLASAGYIAGRCAPARSGMATGTLANELQWQVLAPQRPSDRIEVRLEVNTGSLTESTQQSGFSHAIPRSADAKRWSGCRTGTFFIAGKGFLIRKRPIPPVIVSYDSTLYNQFAITVTIC